MAKKERSKREPPGLASRCQSASGSKNKKRLRADKHVEHHVEVRTREPDPAKTVVVYIMRSATGAIKIGFSRNLKGRIISLQNVRPVAHRPVKLVRAVRLLSGVASKVEWFTHYLLRGKKVRGVHGPFGEMFDWYSTSPSAASRCLNIALSIVEKGFKLVPLRRAAIAAEGIVPPSHTWIYNRVMSARVL